MGVEHLKKTKGALYYGLLVPRLGAFRAELGASNSDLIKRRMLVAAAAAAVRTAGSAQRFHRAHRETPWRAASALASALSLGCCSYTACSSRLDESRCHSLPTLILLLALALTLTASSFGHGFTLVLTPP